MDVLVLIFFEIVILRFFCLFEMEGWFVKFLFVYGDLWYVNFGVDVEIEGSLIFDVCCFYVYNECKLGIFID